MADRTKKARPQLDLGLTSDQPKSTGPGTHLEVNCSNCGAKFVAYYGYEEENVETRRGQHERLFYGEEASKKVAKRAKRQDALSR